MRKSTFLICLGLVLGVLFTQVMTSVSSCEEDVYSKFVTIEGAVRTVDKDTGRISIPVGQNILFQRTDCKKCLSVAITDGDGNYKLRVGEGKYRVIVNEEFMEGGSSLDPKQQEFVEATDKVRRNVLDIRLRRTKTAIEIETQ